MKDKIYKKNHRVWIRTLGDDMSLMQWVKDPRCPLSERQLRRRCEAILTGAMHMSVEDAVTTICKRRVTCGKPQDMKTTKAERKKKKTETELWQEQCQQVAAGRMILPEREVEETLEPIILSDVERLFSARLVDRLRYRDIAAMVREE